MQTFLAHARRNPFPSIEEPICRARVSMFEDVATAHLTDTEEHANR